ncbi:hypothetical protein AQUCO_06200034v1 [Aquilegia coerulea]|uniref:Alpha-taxilin n=1 Tax=Aquilegia coerulea TaxID=218851 RepID=A0A2G5CD03_AQUCA|nr:hypothetical protein AQUCO_06200034v1 [Aquilegia coerulea]
MSTSCGIGGEVIINNSMLNKSNSDANQLPQVDSLPDGFLESSVESLTPSTTPTSSIFQQQQQLGVGGGANDVGSDSTTVESFNQQQQQTSLPTMATEGSLMLQATNHKEKSTPDCAELLNTKKLESSEVKRKNVKRGFKSEKEFLEFTLKYQQVIAERDSAVAVRDKLESLCRELQRQNKTLMDECKRVSTEGQNMRSDLSTRFHDAIKDVSKKLEEQKNECITQLKENDVLRNKLEHLSDQYAVSEQQFTQELKKKNLELQLADLKIQKHEEKLAQEKSQMKLYAEQVPQLLATEKTLRLQLAADGEKFQQFQDALTKSNEVFETFKQEIEKMAKSIKELKKENAFLKGKCERSDVTLIELVEEREKWKRQLEKLKSQKEKLESLCRSLQAERKNTSGGTNDCDPVPVQSEAILPEHVS